MLALIWGATLTPHCTGSLELERYIYKIKLLLLRQGHRYMPFLYLQPSPNAFITDE